MFSIDELTKQRLYDVSRLINDVDGELTPEIIAASTELAFEHGLFLHPSPLRTIALWVSQDVWMYRYIELNIVDGSVYKVGEPQTLAPIDHPLLAEQVARFLARAGRELIASIADRIIVPRETVALVFDEHLASAARMAFSGRAWLTRNGYASEW
ncbi:MAG: hypothetical protein JWQ39_1356 [Glaciihabitans sp.]|jgi:hypothetical protein|nr:hypothetical protein [Glaciihabitans sp.]